MPQANRQKAPRRQKNPNKDHRRRQTNNAAAKGKKAPLTLTGV
ncbi:hypothetical protein [Paraburkholderia elongata]|nr:hypothetical protein [Paraburkholderia elongata]